MSRKRRWTAAAVKVVAGLLVLPWIVSGRTQTAGGSVTATAAAFTQFCAGCHNEKTKSGGLVLDPAQLTRVAENAEMWEKVVRKLRSGAMPPASAPRPDAATYDVMASFLESELEHAAVAHPDVGRLPLFRRLTRTEYRNAVRDLIDVDALPKEMDYSVLLPADSATSGFDNIADLLFVSPATMERYLEAARKISRLAVGDTTAPALVNIHHMAPEFPQDARAEDLPPGTRGGLAIRSYFPADGEYVVEVDLGGRSTDQQLEVTVDNTRVALARTNALGVIRVPIRAGAHTVGVAFLLRNEALPEATVLPRMRGSGTQTAINTVTIRGPFAASGPGDTPSRKRIFLCQPASQAEESACARRILSQLARRAYRRPVVDADLADLMPFYNEGRSAGSFESGIQLALERLLVSPQFLFRIERQPADALPGKAYRVSDLELASRLSFFIWSSIPDDELLDVAIRGELKKPDVLERQTRRMLTDPRSEALITNFATQWLFLGDIALKEPDPLLYRHFDESLRRAMARETELFLDSILRSDRSVLRLLDADYTFLNERLAEHYGIPNVKGSDFRRVTLPEESPRQGLLGQGSILTLTSYPTRTSPVLRGKYVLENLLAAPPPPPPPNVPALDTAGEKRGETRTLRDAMVQHRKNPACAGCHTAMDPIGFALENFDAVGRWRDRDAGKAIDASGVLPGGVPFDGVNGLKRVLLSRPEPFVGALTEKLTMYALGRNVQYYDMPAVRKIVHDSAKRDYTFASLVQGIVNSAPFQMRQP
jgi:mono/diheme cytochrome c family protein